MKMQVVGIGKRRNGVSKKTGNAYDGTTIYVLAPHRDVQGEKAEEIYVDHLAAKAYPEIKLGDTISVDYDSDGYINDISVVKKAG